MTIIVTVEIETISFPAGKYAQDQYSRFVQLQASMPGLPEQQRRELDPHYCL
jgi:hypothetical protein